MSLGSTSAPRHTDPVETMNRESTRLRGARLASLTQEILAPVQAIAEYCDLIVKDAADLEHGVALDYFQRMQEAAHRLLALVHEGLDPANFTGDRLALERRLRHELRGPLNPLRGYCELLLEDAGEQFLERFVPDVRKIFELSDTVLNRLEDLLSFVRNPLTEDPTSRLTPTEIVLPPAFCDRPLMPVECGRVLVVDDNAHNRDLLVRRLGRDGHEVVPAAGGVEALARLRAESFDLVLLDIMMPEVNGFEVLETIKADASLCHVPVIMVSALNEIDSAVYCIERGAEDYLTRPVNPILLRARINATLEKKKLRDREVEHRQQIENERRRADELLHVILPREIVNELKSTNRVRPRRCEGVAVLFADIVGFTPYCMGQDPEHVLPRLQLLVEAWEEIAQEHAVEKIKTIGDAFMAACGLLRPVANPVRNCLGCASAMLDATHRLVPEWDIRAGLHVGPVVAGMLGRRQYLFDLWGDTVNTAARMQSHGAAGAVTLSGSAWACVAAECHGESLGEVPIKGKGPMEIVQFVAFKS